MDEHVWKMLRITGDEVVRHRIGPLTLFLKKVLNEIWFAASRDEKRQGEPEALPENPEWTRLALPDKFEEFQISPVFPDRSVVVDTDYSYRIFPEARSRVYCRVPAFARITPKARPDMIIAEIPTVILSGTWFGLFTDGELSYALSSTVRRLLNKEHFEPHLIVCPIEISNEGEDELRFEKINLRVERLSIYIKDNVMWADETLLTHHGKETFSDIEMKGVVPKEANGAELVSNPRNPIEMSMAVRSFKMLREFSFPGF